MFPGPPVLVTQDCGESEGAGSGRGLWRGQGGLGVLEAGPRAPAHDDDGAGRGEPRGQPREQQHGRLPQHQRGDQAEARPAKDAGRTRGMGNIVLKLGNKNSHFEQRIAGNMLNLNNFSSGRNLNGPILNTFFLFSAQMTIFRVVMQSLD